MKKAAAAAEKAEAKRLAAEKKKAAQAADEAEISSMKKARGKAKVAQKRAMKVSAMSKALEEIETVSASNIDDALGILGADKKKANELDRHPERRAKAAYKAFEAKWLPQLMNDNPGLRRTQVKQQIMKKWKKSPENPLNQESNAFNFKPAKGKKKR